MDYSSFIDAIRQDYTDEEKRRRDRARLAEEARKKGDDKSVLDRIGDALAGAGGFVKDNLIDAPIEAAQDAVGGVAKVVGGSVADIKLEERRKLEEQRTREYSNMFGEATDEQWANPEFQARVKQFTDETRGLLQQWDETNNTTSLKQSRNESQDVDALKTAAAAAETAINVGSLGVGGLVKNAGRGAVKGAAEAVAKNAVKNPALRRAGENVLADATLGAGYGAVTTAADMGGDATLEDYLRSAGTGAAFGGAISGGASLLNRGVRDEIGQGVGTVVDAAKDGVAQFNALPRSVREGGYVQLPGSRKVGNEMAPDPIGASPDPVPPTAATDKVAEYNPDTPIALTATERGVARGEVDPVTGLRNNEVEPGTGVTTKTRDQMREDHMPKRSLGKKLYEQLIDKGADLKVYNKSFKEKYGKDLAVEDDPWKLYQLRAGMEDAAVEKLGTTVDNMEFARKNNLTDSVIEYGVANQVVNDRAGIYSPALVAAEKAKLDALASKHTPEQVEQIKAATENIQKSWDELVLQPLRDNGMLSPEGYAEIRASNPNYFTSFNLEKYIDQNQRRFARSSSVNTPNSPLKALKGISEDSVSIENPFEALTRHVVRVEQMVQDHRVVDSIARLQKDFPELGFTVREPDVVARRMEVSLDNKELRGVKAFVDRTIKRDSGAARRLQTELDRLNKQGLNVSLKGGSERMAPADITVSGLGGDLPTSKAGQLVDEATNDATDLVKQLETASKRGSKNVDGIRQDVIAEGAGTRAEVNASKLGTQDTRAFITNLIERGSESELKKIRKMIGNRDEKLTNLLDDIEFAKAEYNRVTDDIVGNADEIQRLKDKQVPEGYEVMSDWGEGIRRDVAVPQFVADVLKGKNDIQLGFWEDVLRTGSKPFKAAATIFSPAFLVKNSIRDTSTHWLTSQNISKAERLALLPYAKRWGEAFLDVWSGGDVSKRVAAAGGGSAGVFNNKGNTDKIISGVTERISGEPIKDVKNLFARAAKAIDSKNPLFGAPYRNTMNRVGRALEYAPRVAEAKAAIEKGLSDPAAAYAARQAIGDLQQGGSLAKVLNATTPFFNSIVQGNKRIVDSIVQKPADAAAMLTAGVAIPTIALYTWNRSMYPEVLDQIPEYERENNFIIVLGDEKDAQGRFTQILKVPKNDAAKVFGNNLENGLKYLANEQPETFSEMFLKTLGFAQPIQLERDGELSGSATLGSLPIASNPLVRTPFELATNKSLFTGRDIVPEYLQGLDAKDQVTDSTAPIDALAAQVGISPQQFGTVRQGVSAGLLGGTGPVDQLKKVVVGSGSTRGSNEFYKLRDDVSVIRKKASNAINKAIEAGDVEAAQRIAARYNQITQERFSPWIKTYGADGTDEMREAYKALALNLSSRSIKQRQKSLNEK